MSAGIGMKGGKQERRIIKDHIPRDVDVTFGYIKTLESLVHIAIAHKNALGGGKLKFIWIIRM
jgi:hypothetical protein